MSSKKVPIACLNSIETLNLTQFMFGCKRENGMGGGKWRIEPNLWCALETAPLLIALTDLTSKALSTARHPYLEPLRVSLFIDMCPVKDIIYFNTTINSLTTKIIVFYISIASLINVCKQIYLSKKGSEAWDRPPSPFPPIYSH